MVECPEIETVIKSLTFRKEEKKTLRIPKVLKVS
jgi:hypothetical protein